MSLDFLNDAQEGAEPEPVAATPETPASPARDEQGRFASPAPEPEAAPQPAPAPEPEAAPAAVTPEPAPVVQAVEPTAIPPGYVPMTEVQRERQLKQQERERREELERQLAALQNPPLPPPDRFDDPEGYEQHQQAANYRNQWLGDLHWSRKFAVQVNGQDRVKEAEEWAKARCMEDQFFDARVYQSKDPFEIIMTEWTREQVASKVPLSELDAFLAWKASQQAPETPAPAQAQAQPVTAVRPPPPSPVTPPASIVDAVSAGGVSHIPISAKSSFDGLFEKG